MTGSDESGVAIGYAVRPSLSEWRQRTWYGKMWMVWGVWSWLIFTPLYYLTGAVLLGIILLVVGVGRLAYRLYQFKPEVYADGE